VAVGELCGRGQAMWPWASCVAVGKLYTAGELYAAGELCGGGVLGAAWHSGPTETLVGFHVAFGTARAKNFSVQGGNGHHVRHPNCPIFCSTSVTSCDGDRNAEYISTARLENFSAEGEEGRLGSKPPSLDRMRFNVRHQEV
jgi:hypothetical protein